jgi:hypothetical protein
VLLWGLGIDEARKRMLGGVELKDPGVHLDELRCAYPRKTTRQLMAEDKVMKSTIWISQSLGDDQWTFRVARDAAEVDGQLSGSCDTS